MYTRPSVRGHMLGSHNNVIVCQPEQIQHRSERYPGTTRMQEDEEYKNNNDDNKNNNNIDDNNNRTRT